MMSEATFHFHGELNDFLPAAWRRQPIPYVINGPVALKHPIEAMGVPHTEVDHIRVGGKPAGFSRLVEAGDEVDVYPASQALGPGFDSFLRPQLPSPPRFVVDGHLGRLTTYLRLLGLDTLYDNDMEDEELAQIAWEQERVLLTRDVRLLMRKAVVHGYWLRSKKPRDQLEEVLRRYRLREVIRPWRRCLRCNGELKEVAKEAILDRLEPLTKKYYQEFRICRGCDQVYWKGSHYASLDRLVEAILGDQKGGQRRDRAGKKGKKA